MRTLAVLIALLVVGSGAAAFYGGEKILGQQAQTWVPSPPATPPAALPPSVVTVTQAVPPDSIPPGVVVAPPVLPAASAGPPVATTAPAPATPVAAGQPPPATPAAPQQTPAPIADLGVLGLIGVTVGGP